MKTTFTDSISEPWLMSVSYLLGSPFVLIGQCVAMVGFVLLVVSESNPWRIKGIVLTFACLALCKA